MCVGDVVSCLTTCIETVVQTPKLLSAPHSETGTPGGYLGLGEVAGRLGDFVLSGQQSNATTPSHQATDGMVLQQQPLTLDPSTM